MTAVRLALFENWVLNQPKVVEFIHAGFVRNLKMLRERSSKCLLALRATSLIAREAAKGTWRLCAKSRPWMALAMSTSTVIKRGLGLGEWTVHNSESSLGLRNIRTNILCSDCC